MEENSNNKKSLYYTLMKWLIIISLVFILVGIGITINFPGQAFCLIMIFGGVGLLIVGGFVINLAMFILMFKNAKKYNKYLEENNIDEQAEEEAFKEYINNTKCNIDIVNFRSLSLWLRNYKNAPRDKSKSAWFNLFVIILFIVCCISFIVFFALNLAPFALGCLGLGFASIILLLIIHLVHKRMSTNSNNIDETVPVQLGTVIACSISDEGSVSFGSRRNTQTTRVLSTTYLVYIDVAGEQKKAYSKIFYNKGRKVFVCQNKKLKDMVVIEEK